MHSSSYSTVDTAEDLLFATHANSIRRYVYYRISSADVPSMSIVSVTFRRNSERRYGSFLRCMSFLLLFRRRPHVSPVPWVLGSCRETVLDIHDHLKAQPLEIILSLSLSLSWATLCHKHTINTHWALQDLNECKDGQSRYITSPPLILNTSPTPQPPLPYT